MPEQRIVEAASALGAFGGVTGWAGLRWLGCAWCDGLDLDGVTPLSVCLAVDDIRRPSNAVISEERLLPGHLLEHDGLYVTVPIKSLAYEMRYAPSFRGAAVWFNIAAYSDLVSIAEMDDFLPYLNGWTGVPKLREAMAFVDENSWSPWEAWMLVIWRADAALPRPLCNRPIFDRSGRHLLTPDLLDVEAGLAGEYDGEVHAGVRQRRRDRERVDLYRELGIELVTMIRGDTARRDDLVRRMLRARERARFEAESRRSWTIELPPWWIPTFTVAQRRALSQEQRRRYLGHRQSV